MSLYRNVPKPIPSDESHRQQVHFTSEADGSAQIMDVYSPEALWPNTTCAHTRIHGGLEFNAETRLIRDVKRLAQSADWTSLSRFPSPSRT